MASWNIPALVNKISEDVPALKALLTALFKWTDADTTDVPEGAKRLQSVSGGKQVQEYSGSAWGSVGKLMHDVDMLDGKHASTAQTADTIPVRDANGSIPGNITGNAATATTASSVSSEYVVPIANGGTGATSAANARTNLGTNNAANINAGILGTSYGGTGRNDGKVTDVFLTDYQTGAVGLGQLGESVAKNGVDCDTLTRQGCYFCTGCTFALHYPYQDDLFVQVFSNGDNIVQIATYAPDGHDRYERASTDGGASWCAWRISAYSSYGMQYIYIAKNGSDSYTGRHPTSPVLTLAAAKRIVSGMNTNNGVAFCFGPGEWGDVEFYGDEFSCESIYICNLSHANATTKSDFDALTDVPHFTSLGLYSGRFHIRSIDADKVFLRGSFLASTTYFKFGHFNSYFSYARFDNSYTVKKVADFDNVDIFYLWHSSLFMAKGSNTFESGCDQYSFIWVKKNSSIDIISGTTWSGTFAGRKFGFKNPPMIEGMAPTSWPGSQAGSGGYFLSNQYIAGDTIDASAGLTGVDATFTGTLVLSGRTDASTDADNGPALVVGGTRTQSHIEIDGNEIIAKSGATGGNALYINDDDSHTGRVQIGPGGLTVRGPITGNVTGNCSGSSGSCTGNAATATKLKTARNINGVAFDGSANITVADSTKLPLTGGKLTGDLSIQINKPYFYLCNTDVTRGSKPSSHTWTDIFFHDKNTGNDATHRLGYIECQTQDDGDNGIILAVYPLLDKNETTRATFALWWDANGDKYCTAPTPPSATDNSTKVATTAWVTTALGGRNMRPGSVSSKSVNTSYTASSNGYFFVEHNSNVGNANATATINGTTYTMHCGQYGSGGQHSGGCACFPVKNGWSYKCNSNASACRWLGVS